MPPIEPSKGFQTVEQAIQAWNASHTDKQKIIGSRDRMRTAGLGKTIFVHYNEQRGYWLDTVGRGNPFLALIARGLRYCHLSYKETRLAQHGKKEEFEKGLANINNTAAKALERAEKLIPLHQKSLAHLNGISLGAVQGVKDIFQKAINELQDEVKATGGKLPVKLEEMAAQQEVKEKATATPFSDTKPPVAESPKATDSTKLSKRAVVRSKSTKATTHARRMERLAVKQSRLAAGRVKWIEQGASAAKNLLGDDHPLISDLESTARRLDPNTSKQEEIRVAQEKLEELTAKKKKGKGGHIKEQIAQQEKLIRLLKQQLQKPPEKPEKS